MVILMSCLPMNSGESSPGMRIMVVKALLPTLSRLVKGVSLPLTWITTGMWTWFPLLNQRYSGMRMMEMVALPPVHCVRKAFSRCSLNPCPWLTWIMTETLMSSVAPRPAAGIELLGLRIRVRNTMPLIQLTRLTLALVFLRSIWMAMATWML